MGLSVGLIQTTISPYERKKNYNCDIVYLTNNELGFDYLFDNMVFYVDDIVQKPFYSCIIDEVDSILIDEARTPLIVSGPDKISTFKYLETNKLINHLKREIHYKVDEKNQTVILTKEGASFCEKALYIINLSNSSNPWIFYILNSIKAKELFKKNKNYIINNNKIIMVDEFTGRTMKDRRWSNGLQQAIEAKENLSIKLEKKTLASISYQNLFLRYKQIAGMTGTAKTEENEFKTIYNLSVITVPTNKPIKRKDLLDLIYKNQYTKWCGITQECLEMYNISRPVLIGTINIEKSELLAILLTRYDITYKLLNAKRENVKNESNIVAQAGFKKAITIATNMAGRGTDITLGCNSTYFKITIKKNFFYRSKNLYDWNLYLVYYPIICLNNFGFIKLIKYFIDIFYCQVQDFHLLNFIVNNQQSLLKESSKTIKNLGGLYIIGTERHESRRIDNQLRGRSGRQGDPGSSRFFLCLEDKILRIFGGKKIFNRLENIGFKNEKLQEYNFLINHLEFTQKKVETFNFETRKKLFEYDQILSIQRNFIYFKRKNILGQKNNKNLLLNYTKKTYLELLSELYFFDQVNLIFYPQEIENLLNTAFPFQFFLLNLLFLDWLRSFLLLNVGQSDQELFFFEIILNFLQQEIEIGYDLKSIEMRSIENGLLKEVETSFIIYQIDNAWTEHLQQISFLKDTSRWISVGQQDPLKEYKNIALNYYYEVVCKIRHLIVYYCNDIKSLPNNY